MPGIWATPSQQKERERICLTCEHLRMGICTKCGCVIKGKVKFAKTSCPLKKWDKIEVKKVEYGKD
jgi:hypothetical protein